MKVNQTALDEIFSRDEVQISVQVGYGSGVARMFTSDLTKGYVEINSEYTT